MARRGSASARSCALADHGTTARSFGGSVAVCTHEPNDSSTGPTRQPWRVAEVGERAEGGSHGGRRCFTGEEEEDHGGGRIARGGGSHAPSLRDMSRYISWSYAKVCPCKFISCLTL